MGIINRNFIVKSSCVEFYLQEGSKWVFRQKFFTKSPSLYLMIVIQLQVSSPVLEYSSEIHGISGKHWKMNAIVSLRETG